MSKIKFKNKKKKSSNTILINSSVTELGLKFSISFFQFSCIINILQ